MMYENDYREARDNPKAFWSAQAEKIAWFKKPETVLSQDENGIDRWFADGELNTSFLALDSHVLNGRGDQTALIYDSPVTNSKRTYT